MRCREAEKWLDAQPDGNLAGADKEKLQEHLNECQSCRAYQQRLQHLDTHITTPSPRQPYMTISTERIMMAVERQRRITAQLEDIRAQQQTRITRLRVVGPTVAALTFFAIGCVPLLALALAIFQPDLLVKLLALPGDGIDMLIVLAPYLQSEVLQVARDNWLMSGLALVLVVMMAMWLRLMRPPRETQV